MKSSGRNGADGGLTDPLHGGRRELQCVSDAVEGAGSLLGYDGADSDHESGKSISRHHVPGFGAEKLVVKSTYSEERS